MLESDTRLSRTSDRAVQHRVARGEADRWAVERGTSKMLVNWHAHVFPPEEAAAPEWRGRCPMNIETLLEIHEAAGFDLAVMSSTLHYLQGRSEDAVLAGV